jgi:hypothetical protein
MESVKNEYQRRKEEINQYFDFLQKIETGEITHSFALPAVMRATCILLLYNLLESIVILTIDHIHIAVSTKDELSFGEAIDELKKIWIEYKYKNFEDEYLGSDKIFSILQNINNDTIKIYDERTSDKKDYLEKVKGISFSGKIDAQQVRKFAQKYGFTENKRVEGKRLVQIKKKRNDLAHGEISFQDCGNIYTFRELKKLKKETFLFLREFLNNVETFINSKKYKKNAE